MVYVWMNDAVNDRASCLSVSMSARRHRWIFLRVGFAVRIASSMFICWVWRRFLCVLPNRHHTTLRWLKSNLIKYRYVWSLHNFNHLINIFVCAQFNEKISFTSYLPIYRSRSCLFRSGYFSVNRNRNNLFRGLGLWLGLGLGLVIWATLSRNYYAHSFTDQWILAKSVSPVDETSGRTHALHASNPGSPPGLGEYYSRCKNLALYIIDCESLCLSDETVTPLVPSIWCLCQGK